MPVWDESTPLGSDPMAQGDDRIREAKAALGSALAKASVFPGPNPDTDPEFYPGIEKAAEASRPVASADYAGRLFINETDGNDIERIADDGSAWVKITKSPEANAIHQAVAAALASVSGVITLPETGNSFNVSGTEAVTQIAGWSAGIVIIKWGSARTLTHAAGLYLLGAISRAVAANDVSIFEFTGSNTVREISFYSGRLPTRQTFLSGSGTYTTPVGCRQLRIRMVGGGGGGGGRATSGTPTAAGAGGDTSFNSVVAKGGGAGTNSDDGGSVILPGGVGGSGGSGSATLRIGGGGGSGSSSASNPWGAVGGNSAFGGGAPSVISDSTGANGVAGGLNSGGGGGGGAVSAQTGAGGGGGEYVELNISAPAATYSYAVGAGGAGGIGNLKTGGAGGAGLILVEEIY